MTLSNNDSIKNEGQTFEIPMGLNILRQCFLLLILAIVAVRMYCLPSMKEKKNLDY